MIETYVRWVIIVAWALGVMACTGSENATNLPDGSTDGDTDADADSCECHSGDGPCCDGCNFYQASDNQVCEAVYEYACASSACGSDTQKRTGEIKCKGGTSVCTGDPTWGDWVEDRICNSDQLCKTDGTTYAACTNCEHGCADQACRCDPLSVCCESDGTWTPHESAEVLQPGTDLYWLRCPQPGEAWSASRCTCIGEPARYLWDDAMSACPPGYRVASRQEYVELLGGCDAQVLGGSSGSCDPCDPREDNASSTCTDMFGSDTGYSYWSSTEFGPDRAWAPRLSTGFFSALDKDASFTGVRCVRTEPEIDAGI